MFKTKAELIADLIAKNASKEEIAEIRNTTTEDLISTGSIEGKTKDVASKGVNVASENTTPENTDLDSESTSSALETPVDTTPTIEDIEKPEEVKKDPYEDFYIKPSFFGEPTNDGGTKNKPSEEDAARELNEKLSGLGIKVIESKPGFNAITLIGGDGEEDIDLGLWKGFMTADDETPAEKAERINGLINDVIAYKTEQNPLFDIDTYVNAMSDAKADLPEVYSASEDGGRFLNVDELDSEQLNDHTHRVHLNLMNKYWESDEGKENIKLITDQRKEQQLILWEQAVDEIQAGTDIYTVIEGYTEKLDNAYDEVFNNNTSYKQMLTNTTAVIDSLFKDKIQNKRYEEGITEEFGGFIASSDILTAFAKGSTVVFPKEIQEFTAMQSGNKIKKLKEKFDALKDYDSEDFQTGSHFKSGNPEISFPLKKYKVSDLRQKYLEAITVEEMSMIGNLMESERYKAVLDKITKPNSELFTKDGKLNITSTNWELAIGDQAFRMLSSIFSAGTSTLVSEASGAWSQILQTKAQEKADAAGKNWGAMSKEEKVKYMLDVIDSGEDGYNEAMTVGGINTALENASNVFFVGKMAKFVPSNITGYFKLFMKGKYRKILTDIAKNANVKNTVDILTTSGVEMVTEGLQEEVTQYGVGTALDNYNHSWNGTLNSMITAAVTTPFIGGGTKATSAIYSEVSSKIAAIKNPEGIIAYVREQKGQYKLEEESGEITTEKYEELMIQLDAAEKMFSETDKVVTDSESVKMILEAQVEIEKQLVKVRDLNAAQKKAKNENPNYDEKIDGAETKAELDLVIQEIVKLENTKKKAKRADSYRTQARDRANEINNDPVKSQDFDAKVFNTTQEAISTLEKQYGITIENASNLSIFAEGKGNGIVMSREDIQKIIPGYEGKGICFWSDEAINKNINEGDRFAANALTHEDKHLDFYYKSDEELSNAQNAVLNILKDSKSPQMQEIRTLIGQRLMQYEKEFGKDFLKTRDGIEEFFASISDATSVLAIDALTLEDRKTILAIGKELIDMIDVSVVDGFRPISEMNVDNAVEFLQNLPGGSTNVVSETYFDDNGNIVTSIDTDGDVTQNVLNSLRDGKTSDLILVEDANPYSKNRSNEDIDFENKRLNKLIEKHETYVDPNGDLEMQAKVRAGSKRFRDMLLFNNYGAFMKKVLSKYDDTKPGHSDERKEFFIGESIEQLVRALQTYNKDKESGEYVMKNDSFSAYYFGAGGANVGDMSIAEVRLAKIWDDMQMDFKLDVEALTGDQITNTEDAISDYNQDYVLDLETKLNDFNERSALRESLAGVMEFEVDGENYNNWIKKQSDLLKDFNFSEIYGPNATKDMKKIGQSLWKNLRDLAKKDGKLNKLGEPTQLYTDMITETVETFYNNMNQKTFNKVFPEFVDVIEERGSVDTSKGLKGKAKPKDTEAGNKITKKKEFTEEIREQILERLLKTDEIAELEAQGLSNAEIHKKIRMDMLQESTLKHYSEILFDDAAMQIVSSEEFKKENGVAQSEVLQVGILLDKGQDVKFSLPDGGEQTLDASVLSSQYFGRETDRLIDLVEGYEDSNNWDDIIDIIQADPIAPQQIKDWVSSMYDKGVIESAGEKRFKAFTVDYLRSTGQDKLADEFNKGGNIRFNKEARDNMIKNAAVFTKIFGKEFMESAGFDWLGFKSGNRYLDIKGKKEGSVKGEAYEAHQQLVSDLKSIPEEDLPGNLTYEDLANIRMMNKMSGKKDTGIFKRIITILESDKTKAQKLKEIQESGLQADIDAANDANEKVFKTIITEIAEQVKEGNVDEVAVLEMFKMQSNLVEGFRGMSRLDGYLVLNGSQKGTNWKGEHMKPMSVVSSEIIELIQKYKTDPSIDLSSEIDLILSDYTQILGDPETFDVLDVYGKANVGGINRFAALSDAQLKGITNASGSNARAIQAEILRRKSIKENVVKSKKKAEAIENINQKTISGEVQGTTVMDFDLTVGESSNVVVATNPETGETRSLDGVGWAKDGDRLLKNGWTMDFSDFNKVTDGRPGPLMQKLKNQIKKYGVDNVHILTARAAESAPAIYAWLQSQGINLPLENIVGLGNSTGQAKADWIENNLILNGFNDIYFVDDHHENVEAVQNMFNEYPPGLLVDGGKSVIVEAAKANTDNKVLFMVGGPGSGKSTIVKKGQYGENYTVLNPDEKMEADLKAAGLSLDRSIYEKGSPELSQWSKIQQAAIKQFKEDIRKGREAGIGMIIDATGASPAVMKAYYDAFGEAGYSIGAIGVQTTVETSLFRNTERERVLSDRIAIDTWNKVQANIELYKEMFGDNFFEVFTDDMLIDDDLPSDFVRDVSNFTMQNPLEFGKGNVKLSLSDTFNTVLEETEGIKAEAVFSEAQGKIRGANAGGILDIVYPPSAYDFEMFTYKYMAKGEKGEQQALFFKEKLFDPYEKAIQQVDQQKQAVRDDYTALVKELPQVKKNLKKNVEGTNYTVEQAVRVYTWVKNGIEVPGLSKRDQKALIKAVEADRELVEFSDRLSTISRQKEGYITPSEYWTVEGISYDLTEMTGKVGREKALAGWKKNAGEIFSEENKNKLRALYGNDHVEALEDTLYRMEYGIKKGGAGRIERNWNNWVNNSVGAVMFFNMRSAALQTISAANYMDWENNNPAKAAMAFANQPQYWKDFSYIFNSDYLKERRSGNKRTINEAELSAHLKGSNNKAKAALAWLLEKGFTPTQIADSFAISSGGASFYRNQVKAYEKSGMSTQEAEAQAWTDFRDKTEKGQQSSRPDLISQQQAGGLGRLILAFKNTPMQYNRLMIKAIADLKNNRGSAKANLSKIAYYGAVQNVIFTSLQTALFSALGDEDEWDTKKERVANGMIDSILNGMGLTGAIAVTIKNGYLQYSKQKEKGFNADHTRTILEFANLSPTIGSKLRKLYGGIRTEQINQGAIEEMGFNINNPAFNSLANVISATTNIPLDRAVNKIQNILLASKSETEAADKIALVLGWNPWDLNLETESRKVNVEVKEKKKQEKKSLKKAEDQRKKEEALKKKQEEQKKKGEPLTCSKCNRKALPGKTVCTVHEVKEQTKGGKEKQCSKIKKDKSRCKVMTANKSGLCYYHD